MNGKAMRDKVVTTRDSVFFLFFVGKEDPVGCVVKRWGGVGATGLTEENDALSLSP